MEPSSNSIGLVKELQRLKKENKRLAKELDLEKTRLA